MVAPYKIKEVENLAVKLSNTKVLGLVDISNVPSKQFQLIRKKLRSEDVEIKVGKNSIMKRAFEKSKKAKDLSEKIEGSIGILFTDKSPFRLSKFLNENKTYAPAKPGMIAPNDIIIPAGGTSLAPGPVLGELQSAKIKAKIKGGKIVVTEDSLVCKKGERISAELASALPRLNIFPREISLDMKGAFDESGLIYDANVLKINTESVIGDMKKAAVDALNFAFNVKLYTSKTVTYFVQDAYNNTFNLALTAEILTKDTIPYLLSKAETQAQSLSSRLPVKEATPKSEEKPLPEEKKAPSKETKE